MGLTQLTSGLLYSSGFANLTGWTNESGSWSPYNDPTFMCWGPLPLGSLGPNEQATKGSDFDTARDGILYIEKYGEAGETWYLIYDSGDHKSGWQQYIARSEDKGLTWARLGLLGTPLGTYGCTDTEWVIQHKGEFILYRLPGAGFSEAGINYGVPEPPYSSDIWTASSLTGGPGSWTFVETIAKGGLGEGWAKYELGFGCVVESGGTWYGFVSARKTKGIPGKEATQETVGYMTASSPKGPWTLHEPAMLPFTFFHERQEEGSRCFYHKGLERWVLIGNLVSEDWTRTDTNFAITSSTVTGFGSSNPHIVQQLCPLDRSLGAIGSPSPAMGPENKPIEDNGYVPVVFDGNPNRLPTSWHLGREELLATYEPTAYAGKIVNSEASIKTLVRELEHTSFVAEFCLRCEGKAGGYVGFRYRQAVSGTASYYEVVFPSTEAPYLRKVTAGSESTIATGTGATVHGEGTKTNQVWDRVKIEAIGATHKIYLNGTLVLEHEDSAYGSGKYLSLTGYQITAQVRLLSIRKSQHILVKGLPAGQSITLRTWGGMPVQQVIANSAGEATFTVTHGPYKNFEVDGTAYTPTEGIWGGDEYSLTGIEPLKGGWVFPLNEVAGAKTQTSIGTHIAVTGERVGSTIAKMSVGAGASSMGGRTAATPADTSIGVHVTVIGGRTGLAQPHMTIGAHTVIVGERDASMTIKTSIGSRTSSTGGRSATTGASVSSSVRVKAVGEHTGTVSSRFAIGGRTTSRGERVANTSSITSAGIVYTSLRELAIRVSAGMRAQSSGQGIAAALGLPGLCHPWQQKGEDKN